MIVYTHSRPDTPIEGPFLSPLTHRKMQQAPGLGWMSFLMSMTATEGEFLLISGKSRSLCSSAQRDEMMSSERYRKEQKGNRRRKSAAEQVQEKA